jgi:hypothetical protein
MVAMTIASTGSPPSLIALRTTSSTWPSRSRPSGSRSSVQRIVLRGPCSSTTGRSASRFCAAAEPSLTIIHIPIAFFQSLADVSAFVVVADPGGEVRVERRAGKARGAKARGVAVEVASRLGLETRR